MGICIFSILLLISKVTFAVEKIKESDSFDLPQVVAVENKKFNPTRDVTLQLGVMPLDAFYKALTAGVSYTHSLSPYTSWEIINANYAFKQDTDLKKDLVEKAAVKPKGLLDNVKYYLTSDIVYTPIYSKNLLFNKNIMYGEWSFVGGGGVAGYESGDTAVIAGVGLISRFFKNNEFSYKFDSRLYYQSAANKNTDLLLMINIGFSFEFGDTAAATRSL